MRFRIYLLAMLTLVKISNGLAADTNPPAVIENLFAEPAPVITNTPANGRTFEVRGYRVEGNNNVLPPDKFGVLSNYTGTVDFARVKDGLGALQLLYRDLGFATVSVTLPQQKLTNGIVRVKVVEGKLAQIKVTGNRWFSTENVLRALPSLDTNILLNTKWFQPELDRANQNSDRQIYPVISPGLDPGTSDLTLQVKDRLPVHGHMEINNQSTPGTPLLRLDTAVQYNNLWQHEHQIGFDYNFSPQGMKPGGGPLFYDQPEVASYSTFYRLPLGYNETLRAKNDNLPVDFGYNEVTHQFNLPPATGNPDLIFYASASTTDTPLNYGPLTTVVSVPLITVLSQSQTRNPSDNYNLGTKLTVPLQEFLGIQSSLLFGFDYKYFQSQIYSTNVTTVLINSYNPNDGTYTPYASRVNLLPANGQQMLYYLPLSLGWMASRPDKRGMFSFNFNEIFFFEPLADARSNFQSVAGSSEAGGNYTTINAGLVRLQNLPGNWSAVLNVNGQWASKPLISNEQFALGGTSGVRGYQDGANYGDTGWRTLFDLRTPPINVGHFPVPHGEVPAYLRPSVFMDYGQTFHLEDSFPSVKQWGTGAGFYLTAGEHFEARLTLAWALQSVSQGASAGSARAYFTVGLQF